MSASVVTILFLTMQLTPPAPIEATGSTFQEKGVISFFNSDPDPCEYMGLYDGGSKSCVLTIQFSTKMKHLTCATLEDAGEGEGDSFIKERLGEHPQKIVCQFDPLHDAPKEKEPAQ